MNISSPETAPIAVQGLAVEPRKQVSNYPAPFAERMAGRQKRVLGNLFGLRTFGVNLTRLSPGAVSSLHHRHTRQDEFIWIVEGEPTLVVGDGEMKLQPGMCAGFPADGAAHHLENRTDRDVLYLEMGDRGADDVVDYPHDDLTLRQDPATGRPRFAHKDGRFY